jgi:hypothetical protein
MTAKELAEKVLRACVREMHVDTSYGPHAYAEVAMGVVEDALVESGACTRNQINVWGSNEERKRNARDRASRKLGRELKQSKKGGK